MHFRGIFLIIFVLNVVVCLEGLAFTDEFNLEAFYTAFSKQDAPLVDEQLETIDPQTSNAHQAYAGALLMKKSGMLKRPKDKLDAFKRGRDLLEAAISKDLKNAEYRFLRLVIQEQAPGILKYNDKKEEDAAIVTEAFAELPRVVQSFVKDYAQNSETLVAKNLE